MTDSEKVSILVTDNDGNGPYRHEFANAEARETWIENNPASIIVKENDEDATNDEEDVTGNPYDIETVRSSGPSIAPTLTTDDTPLFNSMGN